jgi:hypothetical protein
VLEVMSTRSKGSVRRLNILGTLRWTTYDAAFFGTELPKGVPASQQDRAYTSPLWYTPDKRTHTDLKGPQGETGHTPSHRPHETRIIIMQSTIHVCYMGPDPGGDSGRRHGLTPSQPRRAVAQWYTPLHPGPGERYNRG